MLAVLYNAVAGIRWVDVDFHNAGVGCGYSWVDALCGPAALRGNFAGKGTDAIVGESRV